MKLHSCSPSSGSSYPRDLLFALGTVRSVSVIIALGAEDGTSLLKEASLVQNDFTLRAGEFLGVPRTAQRHQVTTPGRRESKSAFLFQLRTEELHI